MKRLLLCILIIAAVFTSMQGFAEDISGNDVSHEIINKVYEQIPSLSQYKPVINPSQTGYTMNFSLAGKLPAQVSTNQSGIVLSFLVIDKSDKSNGKRLPKISKTDATQKAIEFLQYAAADIYEELNVKGYISTYASSPSSGYNIRINRSISGIAYSHNGVNVWVDGMKGEVTRYTRMWNDELQYSPTQEIITKQQAEEFFKSNIGLELRYNKKTEKGKAIPYLVYVPSNTGSIDAATGDAVNYAPPAVSTNYNEILALYEKTSIAATAIESDNSALQGLVSGRAAQKYARAIPELKIDENYETRQAKYYKNTNEEYLLTLEFVKGTSSIKVTVDAKTLGIMGFINSEAASKKSSVPVDKLKLTALTNNFINTYMTQYKNELSQPQVSVIENEESKSCVILYERTVNGLMYKSNYAQFLVSSDGTIVSMAFLWDAVDFESPVDIISANQAYNAFLDKVGLQLLYMNTPQSTARLVYAVNPQVPAIIDAKDGTLLSYDGTKAKPKKSLAYIGLEGHYAEKQATVLADCDIFVSEGNVILDDNILQKDFMILISSISPDGMPIYQTSGGITDEELDMIYKDLITKGVLDKDEADPEGHVTREDAVKYLLRVGGYKTVAELDGIFKMPFNDSKKISPELYGYVALARGLNIISGSEGYFYPLKKLTNADAIILAYNYLNRGNQSESL